jgi:putative transposase
MTEDEKMQVAVFRFSVIGDFVTATAMSRAEKRRLMRDKRARKWQIPFSEKTRISRGTIQRWCRIYRNSGGDLKSLHPRSRSDQGKARTMDEETCLSLIGLSLSMNLDHCPKIKHTINKH